MTTTPPHRPGPTRTPATDPAPIDPAAAPGGLSCPQCQEPARAVPPTEWPLAGWERRPRHSHHDGTPLCPVPTHPGGSRPAEPVTTHGRATPDTAPPPAADPATGPGAPVPVPALVYVVAGGDMVAAFADEASADIQDVVMTGAGLDTTRSSLARAMWVRVCAELRRRHPDIEIIDVSGGPS